MIGKLIAGAVVVTCLTLLIGQASGVGHADWTTLWDGLARLVHGLSGR